MVEIKQRIIEAQKKATWLAFHRAAGEIKKASTTDGMGLDITSRMAFLSSFTVAPLVDYLVVESASMGVFVEAYLAPYGQIAQEILNPASALYAADPEMVVVIAEYDSLDSNPLRAAEQLIQMLKTVKTHTGAVCVLGTFVNRPSWPLHLLPPEADTAVAQANQLLKTAFSGDSQVQICDVDQLAAYHGYARAFSPEMMAMAKMPFSEEFLLLLAQKMVSHIRSVKGLTKKCLVLDGDNTLWGGIIGEDGLDGLTLGPDWPGREFVAFQKTLLELYEQGVILAINSKNNEADLMQVLRDHPHMVLRPQHFAAIAANWDPKPDNMRRIAEEINIGLDSMVFVDDNPAERAMMRQMLPAVDVLELPSSPALYARTLRETNFFARACLTDEDRQRGRMYAAQRQRAQLQHATPSLADYLASLEMVCTIRPAEEHDVKRAAQLTQRTNQFNLTTRRYAEADIRQMRNNPDWGVYVLGLKDKFGDNGTVGLALVEKRSDQWRIDTFLMSCRVIGRQAEEALLDRICRDAVQAGADTLTADYIQTAKNGLVQDFWQKMNFTQIGSDETTTGYQYKLSQYQTRTFDFLSMK